MSKAVYYLQYSNPAALPPLEHSALIFRRAGYQVFLSGIAEAEGSGLITIAPELASCTRLWKNRQPGWRQKLHYLFFVFYHLWRIARAPRGWIYASDLLACPVVCLVKLLKLGRIVYHEHDSPSDPSPTTKRMDRLMLGLRRRAAREADLVVLPNLQRAEALDVQRSGKPKAWVVWNCPRKEEVGAARPEWNGGVLRVLYHGSIVPERLPVSAIDAVAQFSGRLSLSIVGYFPDASRAYAETLRMRARGLGVESLVKIEGVMPRSPMLAFAATHDVGLAFMPPQSGDINMQHMIGASNKVFDYLAVGVALLVSDLPDWRAMYVDAGYALACNPGDADSVATAFQQFLDDPKRMRRMGEQGRQRILSGWNYETQFDPVIREMERVTMG